MDITECLTEKWESTFPPLVTVKGNNKPSVELFACASVFISSSTPEASVLSFQGL